MTQLTTLDGSALSPLAFGTMQFGGTADADASAAMYAAARAVGINHFDTALVYNGGASEKITGQLTAPERDKVFVATKVGYTGGASAANITQQFEMSRSQLGLDVVDLLYMHRFDPDTPLEETFETLALFQSNGLIRYIGVSNYAAWQVVKAIGAAAKFGVKLDAIQPMYSLVKRQAEVEILPMAQDFGLSIFPYSPLGGGLLTGKYARGVQGRLSKDERYKARYGQGWMTETANQLSELANDLGTHPATLAVAWAARHCTKPAPIISARSVEQLTPSLDALRFAMDDALYDRITALSLAPPSATDRLEEA